MPKNQRLTRRLLQTFMDAPRLTASETVVSQPSSHQKIRPTPPVHPAYWSFTLAGLVETPLILSYDDTLALPAVDVPCTIFCNGGSEMNTAVWRGLRLQTLLSTLNIHPAARYAQFIAADGYTTGISLEVLSQVLLAYKVNGEPLSHEQGFPVRLIVPGLYGYKMPKWITRIELTHSPVYGFWEQRGWSVSGIVETTALIRSPRHRESVHGSVTLRGTAFAGEHSLSSVEVSIDDGLWMPVPFTPGPAYCASEWQIDWQPTAPGDFLVKVRASDNEGNVQHDDSRHAIVVRVANT
jgi:DMSO/TMAO reductase YedYZ molybdopterin-dependent catalytic subunit